MSENNFIVLLKSHILLEL